MSYMTNREEGAFPLPESDIVRPLHKAAVVCALSSALHIILYIQYQHLFWNFRGGVAVFIVIQAVLCERDL